MHATQKQIDIIYPELSYNTMGALFEVWTSIGPGHKESFYQKAVARELENRGIQFKEQVPVKVNYKGKPIGIYYFDYLIEGRIVLEIKVRNYFSKNDIEQLFAYLRAKNLRLGIIAHFTKGGVKFKRVVNIL